jgi:hypothetical protein
MLLPGLMDVGRRFSAAGQLTPNMTPLFFASDNARKEVAVIGQLVERAIVSSADCVVFSGLFMRCWRWKYPCRIAF